MLIIQRIQTKKPKVLKVVEDQFGSPTWTHRLALQIKELLHHDGKGTYHATSEGYCSRLECAEFIIEKLGLKARVEPCSMKDLHDAAKRPYNCLLENRLLKKQGINVMPDWKEDLNTFLEKFGEELIKEAKEKRN